MLSLKQMVLPSGAAQGASLRDLPPEILGLILAYVCAGERVNLQTVISVSLVCRRFRPPASAILWENVEIAFGQPVTRHGQTLIDFLLERPHVSALIRSVTLRDGVYLGEDPRAVTNQFKRLYFMLKALRTIRMMELNLSMAVMLDLLRSSLRPVHLIVEHQVVDHYLTGGDLLESLKCYSSLPSWSQLSLGFDIGLFGRTWNTFKPTLLQIPNLKALKLCQWLNDSIRVALPPSRLDYDDLLEGKGAEQLKGELEELEIDDNILRETSVPIGIHLILKSIPWSEIRRLSLTGRGMVEDFFPRAVGKMKSLECLRLSSPNPQSYLFAVGLVGSAYDNSIPATIRSYPEDSPFRRLPSLRELELDGISNAFPLEYIQVPKLEKLMLHLQEASFTIKTQGARSAEELRRSAALMPFITHLEVDIGQIGNLWHPTAIPGVDVDVNLYQILDAFISFPMLSFLRLFPPYIVRGTQRHREPTYRQPLSDEQAIKVFRHLRLRRPSLQALSITADRTVAKEAHDFFAASWDVSTLGEKTNLTTRQSKRNYEQIQIWEGERRLTSRIKTLAYSRPYIPDPEGWILPSR